MDINTLCVIVVTTFALTKATKSDSESPFMVIDANGTTFNFNIGSFKEFQQCLCSNSTGRCTAHRYDYTGFGYQWVYKVDKEYLSLPPIEYSNRYMCVNHTSKQLKCHRLKRSENGCQDTSNCRTYHVKVDGMSSECQMDPLEIKMAEEYRINFSQHKRIVVESKVCEGKCPVLAQPLFSAKTTALETRSASTTAGVQNPLDSENQNSRDTKMKKDPDGDESSTKSIISGIVITVVVAAMVIIGLVLWKRRGHSFSPNIKHKKLSIPESSSSGARVSGYGLDPDLNKSTSRSKPSSYTFIDPSDIAESDFVQVSIQTEHDVSWNSKGTELSDYSNNCSVLNGIEELGYSILENDQNRSTKTQTNDVRSQLNMATRQVSRNEYSDIDDTFCIIDGAKRTSNIHSNMESNASNKMVVPVTGSEYSKLNEPVRNVHEPYDILPFENNENSNNASLLISSGPDSHSLSCSASKTESLRLNSKPYTSPETEVATELSCEVYPVLTSANEYSKLYEPVRQIVQPYNVLPDEGESNTSKLPTNSSSLGLRLPFKRKGDCSHTTFEYEGTLAFDCNNFESCDLEQNQRHSRNLPNTRSNPVSNRFTKRQISRNDYSDVDDSFCKREGLNNSEKSNETDKSHSNKGVDHFSTSTHVFQSNTGSVSVVAESESNTGAEYSRLYEPIRDVKNLYNRLTEKEKITGRTIQSQSSSLKKDQPLSCLATPLLDESTNQVMESIEVIEIQPSSKQQIDMEKATTESNSSAFKDKSSSCNLNQLHSETGISGCPNNDSKEQAHHSWSQETNHYFELESNYDSDESETDQMGNLNPYSEIDGEQHH